MRKICSLLVALTAGAAAQMPPAMPAPAPEGNWLRPAIVTFQSTTRGGNDDQERIYQRGTRALDRSQWAEAEQQFSDAAKLPGDRADGALYWKAYAQSKQGKRPEALQTLEELRKTKADSRWANDARALELELQAAAGGTVDPANQADEDLQLLALNSLQQSDPARAVPMLEKIVLTSTKPKLKERALFVLANSGSAQGRDVLVKVAKGGGNPDLQLRAIDYLGMYGGKTSRDALAEIYRGSNANDVKARVLRGFMHAGDKEQLLSLAKSEKDAGLRRRAVEYLGQSGGRNELMSLYVTEIAAEVRGQILRGLMMAGAHDKLLELARTERDPALRRKAVESAGMSGSQVADGLVELYGKETDVEVKKAILRALFQSNNAKALVNVARLEKDPELKKAAVRQLATMKSPEATEYMLELLSK